MLNACSLKNLFNLYYELYPTLTRHITFLGIFTDKLSGYQNQMKPQFCTS